MDLLSGLRKGDSSRGGAADFKWEDVKEDKDRENYLGHSLMAPVGRWQRGKDLTWYAKAGDQATKKPTAEEERRAEIQRIKEAEQDALSEALGFKVVRRYQDPISDADVKRAIREAGAGSGGEEEKEESRGVGYGGYGGGDRGLVRREEGARITTGKDPVVDVGYRPVGKAARREDERRGAGDKREKERRRHRSRSRSRSRDRRRRDDDRERRRRRSPSRRREKERYDDDRGGRDHDCDRDRDRERRKDRSGGWGRRQREDERRPRSRSPRWSNYDRRQ